MDDSTVKDLVEAELAGAEAEAFANWHGITSENIREFLIDPIEVTVVVWGQEPGPRPMWLVLQEEEALEGYLVAFDPSSRMWGLVTHDRDDRFTLVSGLTDTFLDAVIGM